MLNHVRSLLYARPANAKFRQDNHLALVDERIITDFVYPYHDVWTILFPPDCTNEERLYRLKVYETLIRMAGCDFVFDAFDSRISYELYELPNYFGTFSTLVVGDDGVSDDLVIDSRGQIAQTEPVTYLKVAVATVPTNTIVINHTDAAGNILGEPIYGPAEAVGGSTILIGAYGISITLPTTLEAKSWALKLGTPIDFDLKSLFTDLETSGAVMSLLLKPCDDMGLIGDRLWKDGCSPAHKIAGLLVAFIYRIQAMYYGQ